MPDHFFSTCARKTAIREVRDFEIPGAAPGRTSLLWVGRPETSHRACKALVITTEGVRIPPYPPSLPSYAPEATADGHRVLTPAS